MKPQKKKTMGLMVVVFSGVAIVTCIGIISYYRFIPKDSSNDSFCQECPPITQEELVAGWYWGFIDQKKPGTPDTWIHVGGDSLSARWVDPDHLSDNINETCPEINPQELAAGWYFGEINQKKPGTPETWLHKAAGTRSAMWFDPNLIQMTP